MTKLFPKGNTPSSRGPRLGDGAGGTSERPSLKEADVTMRDFGSLTSDVRLTATGTDVSAGEGDLYNFGQVTKASLGRYLAQSQAAASAEADALGAVAHCDFQINEASAGVFTAVVLSDLEGGTAVDDADDTRQSSAAYTAVADPDVAGVASDSRATIFVADADAVSELAAAGYADEVNVGDLVLLEASAAGVRSHRMHRFD